MSTGRPSDDLQTRNGNQKHFLESLIQILRILDKEPLSPTDLLSKRPIHRHDNFYSYLRLLVSHRLIEKYEGIYRITENGRLLLRLFS